MSIIPPRARVNDYPTTDRKALPETDWHRELMFALIATLRGHFAARPGVYVSGNLLVFYEEGNRRRHVSPDVFVARGVGSHERPNYLLWQERRGPEVVIEVTSTTTSREDLTTKRQLYQDTLAVREYFLFDPRCDHLDPPLQGYRLRKGEYQPIRLLRGRLPSQVLGLHLERAGQVLRLWDPQAQAWLPTPAEALQQAELNARNERQRAEEERRRADEERRRADESQEELRRLRAELEALRGRTSDQP
jgi:Uma2 family endonuclease